MASMVGGCLLLVALLTVVSPSLAHVTWESCGEGDVEVLNVTMTPDPAVRGGVFTFNLPAKTPRVIEGGHVSVFVFYKGIPVYFENDDLCVKTKCPITSDVFTFTNTQQLPSITPPGPYQLRIKASDLDGKPLFCAKMKFQIVSGAESKSAPLLVASR
ncbi:hypothetical protein KFL_000180080 [Klebsormidium nitens]|uniref:MD-2-related lipid-recognition domain-containing protein n=1 Tax=Klebsormidium nitens TaxID=105231 RepID=A0A1Y1HJK2_KLENI|nr:hypothetical protein KFL_000180080 [Klebsormidium nitens]|eukprot:GAQ78724.1 hypothetical protein KFL_000180080 [Klebsormidium nitens]